VAAGSIKPNSAYQKAATPDYIAAFKPFSMCGIVGYIGNRQAFPVILKGLKQLEYTAGMIVPAWLCLTMG
jgi:hypothetical protein